ncbi:tRNA uridine-5-carboxymethylaminomethyl(34) synthesis GTPase MnmE [Oceanicoccus sp. KOV_DT_Chl]|uniref:tRNA uridine-5-carboxymethylaminomethyl(34) synthesis GTPase MnmE n=1 Tax=Oceanicoccus sp. KOV_DT_Chl TaxID=1904639 RepID=UPI000C7BCBC9|nr:tRNA uridine-5-carboxymethylaminomethyl(34) synthesis GTPase MnmE [Oceanicoccus sp. KOV_DT_Chl]
MVLDTDTIAAIATAPGRGGVGIIRVSGPNVKTIAKAITGKDLKPRYAQYGSFLPIETPSNAVERSPIDNGISLFFPGPHSFTGEDILELQAHGGPVLLDILLKEVIQCGARLARPGEFSERAFLNNKIDLAQAEAISDLINSVSEQAARNAFRSLQGEFSKKITSLVEAVIQLRVYVEAAIDFPEEEIDFLADGKVANDLNVIIQKLQQVFVEAKQGTLLQEGMTVVIAGKPNAGKSSLLNALSGRESAIVTAVEGTTRDVLREQIQIDGMPLHIIDTAGLRESPDIVEQEGIKRAWTEIEKADRILFVVDSSQSQETDPAKLSLDLGSELSNQLSTLSNITIIHNKCDLIGKTAAIHNAEIPLIQLSAKAGEGIEILTEHLKNCMGFNGAGEGGFTARRRHLVSLEQAQSALSAGQEQLESHGAGELLAEDLRQCQNALSEITGEFTPDDLLGEIFSSFCIGK